MFRKVTQLSRLSTKEWYYLLISMCALPVVHLLLSLYGFKKTQAILARFSISEENLIIPDECGVRAAEQILRMTSIAVEHGPYNAKCLKASLVAWWLLKRRGITANLRIGVNRDSKKFSGAHAWLELSDHVEMRGLSDSDQFIPLL